jgi:hypothetical protein
MAVFHIEIDRFSSIDNDFRVGRVGQPLMNRRCEFREQELKKRAGQHLRFSGV